MYRNHALVLALALVLGLLVVPVPAAPALESTSVLSASPARFWTPRFMSGGREVSLERAKSDARTYGFIAAWPSTYRPHVTAMRVANPSLTLAGYMNASYAQKGEGTKYPADWYLRDANGEKIRSTHYGNWLMNPYKQGWVDTRIRLCTKTVQEDLFDGCMLDMVGSAPLLPGYNTALPINPRTGKVFTQREWLDAMKAVLAAVKAGSGGKVWGNGVAFGGRYFRQPVGWHEIIDPVNGAVAEIWLRDPSAGIHKHRSLASWQQDLAMLVDAGSRRRSILVTVKTWGGGTTAEKNAYRQFSYGSYLLVADGRSRFAFLPTEAVYEGIWHPLYDIDLGGPTGAYTIRANGLYDRGFQNGRVVVNPTDQQKRIDLGRTYRLPSGQQVRDLVLPPYSGRILRL